MVSLFPEIVPFSFWPKPLDYIVRRFDQISLRPHNSSLEGTMKLKSFQFLAYTSYMYIYPSYKLTHSNTVPNI